RGCLLRSRSCRCHHARCESAPADAASRPAASRRAPGLRDAAKSGRNWSALVSRSIACWVEPPPVEWLMRAAQLAPSKALARLRLRDEINKLLPLLRFVVSTGQLIPAPPCQFRRAWPLRERIGNHRRGILGGIVGLHRLSRAHGGRVGAGRG